MASDCLPDWMIAAAAEGSLEPDAQASAEAHLAECSRCAVAVRQRARALDRDAEAEDDPPLPERIGRYVVRGRLGRGGMGIVLEGWDPQLERAVAIKLLRPRAGVRDGTTRLVREAQALARVTDPHVVTVFEAGPTEAFGRAEVYVVMEKVDGATLDDWLQAHDRPTPVLLDVFAQAGRGLAAAHAAGIVHRDFKPANVIVSDDPAGAHGTRVRVMDFGLARATADEGSDSWDERAGAEPSASGPGRLADRLTEVGFVLGTPAYMAPEQHDGRPVDARADQYAFCVALFEALHGVRPFTGTTLQEIAAAKHRGAITVGSSRRIPRRLAAALARGLRPDPAERWPTMDELLAALAPSRSSAMRHALLVGTAALVGLGLVVATTRSSEGCVGAAADLAGVWNPSREQSLRASVEAVATPWAAQTWTWLAPRLHAYAHDWAAARVAACESARTVPDVLDDRRRDCLDDRRERFAALLDELHQVDPNVLARADRMVAALPAVSSCSDPDYLAARVRPPDDPAIAERVAALRPRIAALEALDAAGRWVAARDEARLVLAEARAIGYDPTLAAAAQAYGRITQQTGDVEGAEAALTESYWAASRSDDAEAAAEAAQALVYITGYDKSDRQAADRWARHARAALERIGGEPVREGWLESSLAGAATRAGDYEAAIEHRGRALALLSQALSPDDPTLAGELDNVGTTLALLGRLDEAAEHHERARDIRRDSVGETHPGVATSLVALATVDFLRGRLVDARKGYERALEIREATLGKEHRELGGLLNNLGAVCKDLGDEQAAMAHYLRALAIDEATKGADHPDCALPHNNLAALLRDAGRLDEAQAHNERALAITEAALGPEHADVAWALEGIAANSAASGRPRDAIAPLRRAIAIRDAAKERPDARAGLHFALARALWSTGDREQAAMRAAEALSLWQSAGEGYGKEVDEVRAWLAERPPGPR